MDSSLHFHWLDWSILVVYLAALVGIGVYHARRSHDLSDYFLAGKSMKWIPVGVSLMAALNSGMDYIMQPAGMIKFGAILLTVNLSWLFLYPYVFFITLPLFRRLGGYSAYEYLERRFGFAVRALAAFIFLLWRMGWMAAALYTPCLAISIASGYNDYITPMIVGLGILVTFYTMLGGIRAVIWTDVVQFGVMFMGITVTIAVVLFQVDGGLAAILGNFGAVGSNVHVPDPALVESGVFGRVASYFFIPIPFFGFLVACLVSRGATYTSDQVMVQRFQTSKSIREARRGFIITAVGDAIWMTALCFIGVALFTYFKTHAPPPEILAKEDQLFPYFMGEVFPIGLTGLVIAAILAASLSSIDSATNSMGTVAMTDFYNRIYLGKGTDGNGDRTAEEQQHQVRVSRIITCIIGAIGIVLACNVSQLGSILEIANKLVNGFTGPILGIFLLGMFSRRANQFGVFLGGIAGALVSLYCIFWGSPDLLNQTLPFLRGLFPKAVAEGGQVLSFIWPATFGLVATLVIGYVASLPAGGITQSAEDWNWRTITRRELVE